MCTASAFDKIVSCRPLSSVSLAIHFPDGISHHLWQDVDVEYYILIIMIMLNYSLLIVTGNCNQVKMHLEKVHKL